MKSPSTSPVSMNWSEPTDSRAGDYIPRRLYKASFWPGALLACSATVDGLSFPEHSLKFY